VLGAQLYALYRMHTVVYRILDYLYCDHQQNTFDVQFIHILHNMIILHLSTIIFGHHQVQGDRKVVHITLSNYILLV
jgi:hypothetical protein